MRYLLGIFGTASLVLFSIFVLKTSLVSGAKECSAGCVTTHNYDDSRDNVNPRETKLKASTLTSLHAAISPDLQGLIYTQPLYVSNLVTSKGSKNVVFVATEENWVYALDGDHINNPPLWQTNLNNAGETNLPVSQLPGGCNTIKPEVGVTGTPVVDLTKNLLFVVSAHFNTSTQTLTQRLNVLKLADGTAAATALDIPTALQTIGLKLDPEVQQQRAALALAHDANQNPLIYVAWASYCDMEMYSGKVAAFEFAGTLSALAGFDDEAAGGKPIPGPKGGIWMSGAAPAVVTNAESQASVFLSTGNGYFVPGNGYGHSVLRFGGKGSTGPLDVTGSYTVNAWNILNIGSGKKCKNPLKLPPPYPPGTTMCSQGDLDLGAGGVTLVRPSGSGNLPHGDSFEVLAAGKQGIFYVIDPANMKHSGADTKDPCGAYAIQCLGAIQLPLPCCTGALDSGLRGTGAFWAGNATYQENVLYVIGSEDSAIRAYQMNPGGGGTFNTALFGSAPPPDPDKQGLIPFPGATPVVTWDSVKGSPEDAILWVLDTAQKNNKGKLFAYQAVPTTSGGTFPMVWSDTTNVPRPTKFNLPTVINGHVYVAGGNPNKVCAVGACPGRVVSWQ
jgi:hypothetical protein